MPLWGRKPVQRGDMQDAVKIAPGPQGFFQIVKAAIMPTPGAMEYAMSDYLLAQKPMVGPAIMTPFLFRMFAAQNYQQQAVAALTGVGGLAHGQNVLQPLSDPYNPS